MKKMHLSVMVCLVLTLVSLQADILLEEGFEGGMIPAGWAQSFIVGSNSWVFQNGGHNGNPPSAHSGNYNAHLYNSSWTETMLITPSLNLGTSNPGELTFWHAQANWAGDQDFLYVYYKNSPGDTWTQIASYTTNVPSWTERILILPDPSLTYYIAFKGVTDFGYGVCLDDVTVTGQPIVYDYDLAALEIAGPVNINAGSSAVYEITVKNVGNLMQDSFTINLIRDGTITLVSQDITIPLAPGEELQQNLVWFIPPDEPLGSAELTGQVVAAVDQNNGNDFTPPLTVQIMPQGLAIITVGTGQDLSYYVPWNFYYKNSLTETIYYENELNSGGVITAISYYSNFLTNLPGMPVKVWIGETDITSLENNWISASDLIPVFDAEVDFPSGQHEIQLIFDEEFIYTGGNLVIMAQRPMDTDYYSSSDRFYNTLSSPYPNRTRYAYSDSEPYDPYNPPPLGWSVVVSDRLPNTTFYIIVGGLGTMDGFVRDDQDAPLPGAEVLIQETGDLTITNQDGFYSIINIPEGSYTARASLFGYSPHVQAVEIIGDEITPVDFVLIPLNIVNVSGFVVGSDHPEVGLEGAQISLTGFDDYYTVTDEEGYFFLSGVYTNITYHLEITCEGYEPYSEELFVGGEDLDLGTIVLSEIATPPGNVVALQNEEGTQVMLNWSSPGAGGGEFRYDDGNFYQEMGYGSAPNNAVFGAAHRHIAVIQEIHWYLSSAIASHNNVRLYIFGLDVYGDPDSGQLLYISSLLSNIDNEWNSYVLPNAIEAPAGFLVGVGTPGVWTGIGMDDGTGAPWEFIPETQYTISNYADEEEEWQDLGTINPPMFAKNLMIRAYGIDMGETAAMFRTDRTRKLQTDAGKEITNGRSFESYAVYRFPAEDHNHPELWSQIAAGLIDTTYVDTGWGALEPDMYQFAITAEYTNNIESEPAFSQVIAKTTPAGNGDEQLPLVTSLRGNYPNPFTPNETARNHLTVITYSLAEKEQVQIRVYNLKGQEVVCLVNEELEAGVHEVGWDGKDAGGSDLPTGLYLYQMQTGKGVITRKMLLLK